MSEISNPQPFEPYPVVDFAPGRVIVLRPIARPVYGCFFRWLFRRPVRWSITYRFLVTSCACPERDPDPGPP